MRASVKENRLVGLIFYTEHDGEFLRIEGTLMTSNTVLVDIEPSECLIGFRMRMAAG